MSDVSSKGAVVHIKRKVINSMIWDLRTEIPVPWSKYAAIEAVLFQLSTDEDNFLVIENKSLVSDIAFLQVAHITDDSWCVEVNIKKSLVFSYRKKGKRIFKSSPWTQYAYLTSDVVEVNEIIRSILCESKEPNWTRWKNITRKICLNRPIYSN